MGIKFFACGFDDQMPCARNNYTFGVGATLFTDKISADSFVRGKVISVVECEARDMAHLGEIFASQAMKQKRHAISLGFE